MTTLALNFGFNVDPGSSFVLKQHGILKEGYLILSRTSPVFLEEVKNLCLDIHEIIQSTRYDWEMAQSWLCDFPEEYILPPTEPQSSRIIEGEVVCKETGRVNFDFLNEYENLFD